MVLESFHSNSSIEAGYYQYKWKDFIPKRESGGFLAIKLFQDVDIGPNLRRLRKENGYTQERLASKLQVMGFEVSREVISQMENNGHGIRISILIALKDLYGAEYKDFFE